MPLSQAEGISLPETYQQVELTVQDQQYSGMVGSDGSRYYVLNALNTRTGETHLYQYDTDDGTLSVLHHFRAGRRDDGRTSDPGEGRRGHQ